MSAILRVVFPGALASLQDLGRPGLRRVGVPRAGVLVPAWLRIANTLAGNTESSAVIEFFGGGLALRAEDQPLRLALAGPFTAEIVANDGERRTIASWRSLTLAPGEQLRCGMTQGARVGYVAVAGLDAPQLLGSASTYARAGFGRLLAAGDTLNASPAVSGGEVQLRETSVPEPFSPTEPIRAVPGPQSDYFSDAALQAFFSGEYRVTAEADRMGMRFEGPVLSHRPEKGVEITSDATVPGSVQVPGKGQPIVLLNDGQTAGGYPKIATVISADLPRLAALPVGAVVRFASVSVAEAEQAARAAEAMLQAARCSIEPLREGRGGGESDLDALYAGNLLSGMVDALNRN